jgi:hypothetical protein
MAETKHGEVTVVIPDHLALDTCAGSLDGDDEAVPQP